MYLKTLTLRGFKSFAEKTTFVFEPGVTAVVGPNGSGKSNVVDALAWVMGEQGVKTLRGGKMDDVIFAGTAQKGPLGRAEVTLTIDNSDGALPIEYAEVTIRRRIFRNGGSEYAINGDSCRLLDVQELLSDSGLGRQMHVIVGQGQLDTILRATPEERRGFIEEAAGILKHRRRKERTERKLEAMEANLTRVNDLAGELRRQLKPLGRQAEIARRAQTVQSGLRDTRARLLADDLVRLDRELDDLSGRSDNVRSNRALEQTRADDLSEQITSLEDAELSRELESARALSFQLKQVQERFRSLERLAAQRVALLGERSDQPTYAPEDTEAKALASTEELQTLQERYITLAAESEAADAALVAAANALQTIDGQLREQNALISAHELKRTSLQNTVDGHERTVQTLQQEVSRQQEALQAADRRVDEAERAFHELELTAAHNGVDSSDLNEAYQTAATALAAVQEQYRAQREQIQQVEREQAASTARAAALEQALSQGTQTLNTDDLVGVSDTMTNLVTVQSGFEIAIAAALGDLADGFAAESLETAVAAAQHMRDDSNGRASFIVSADVLFERPASVPRGATWAPDVIEAPSGIHALLASTFIVDDLHAALSAVSAQHGATLVTLLGDVVTAAAVTGGPHDESRLELAAARDDANAAVQQAEQRLATLANTAAELQRQEAEAQSLTDGHLQALRDADTQASAYQEELARGKVQCDAQRAERTRLQDAAQATAARLEQAMRAHHAAADDLQSFATVVEPTLEETPDRDAAVATLDTVRNAQVTARVELETMRERTKAVRERAESFNAQARREREAIQRAARAQAVRSVQLEQAQQILDAVPSAISVIDAAVAEAAVEEGRCDAERKAKHTELQAARERLTVMQRELDAVTEALHSLDMRLHERRLERDNVAERAHAQLGLEPHILVEEYGPHLPMPVIDANDVGSAAAATTATTAVASTASVSMEEVGAYFVGVDAVGADAVGADAVSVDASETSSEAERETAQRIPFDRQQLKRQQAVLERQLAKLGTINPLALEEFAALEQRHTFMTEQLADLQQTRSNLRSLIVDLDDTMQGIFVAAFDDTRRAFDDIFPILFPGGAGTIALTNPDAPLTTGIEISIKPAGKKINRLSLLSGGERSLAAIALLVAIFKARPSPFYVMDEVEAALDDANLGRLLAIFADLRQHAQLIVITHQKRTMEIADALYGVSMRRNGITTVVGQRLQHEEEVSTWH